MRDVDEVLVVSDFSEMLFFCQEPHPDGQREFETAVETTAISESMREVHQHANHLKFFR